TVRVETQFVHIELVWPGKESPSVPRQDEDGRWRLDPRPPSRRLHPFVHLTSHGDAATGSSGLVVLGDRWGALATFRRWYPRRVTFASLDVQRIEIDDKVAAFRGDPTYAYSTWLTVVRAHLDRVVALMSRTGVIAMLSGDIEEP